MNHSYISLILLLFFSYAKAQIVNIPDTNFKNALVNTNCIDTNDDGIFDSDADTNNDGEIQISEAETVLSLNVFNSNIDSLEGISSFINLQLLNCSVNSLSTLDVSDLTALSTLLCSANQLTTLNISGLTNITLLSCSRNDLTALDVSALTNLDRLFCDDNDLTTLNLDGLANLTELDCSINYLTALDLSGLINLTDLNCSNSFDFFFNTLDLSGLTNLTVLDCSYLGLTTLDVNESPNLTELDCSDNELTSLLMKNGSQIEILSMYNNPDLEYICTDDFEVEQVEYLASLFGYTNCAVNSYCFFEPGGNYFEIEGLIYLDTNMDGCDVNDIVYPNLKLSVNDGTINRFFIPANDGSYSFPVLEGTHVITPVFENIDYFLVNPTSITVDFPTDASPFLQDFCITPSGIHNDLEILIVPLQEARPGFDTNYKVVYWNKGSTTLSGTVDFDYNENDGLMEVVSSVPIADNHVNNVLTWNYENLMPFESREILITLHMNTPMESPPLNEGDDIGFIADIYPKDIDETIGDNNFQLKDIVVNSHDPNDKTCLEGTTITLEQVGEYLHYLVRFENTGTASAINVVIKDIIDTNTLDISTLEPLYSSHDFITNIKDDSVVEFIFEDINLPFDDANNDGFVAFKIKTVNSLELGDTIDNTAEIYFDFNFPIITNTSQVNVAALSTDEYVMSNVAVYPNPTNSFLYVEANNNISSLKIFNLLGQQLYATYPNALIEGVDMSGYISGMYLVNLEINGQVVAYRVIKE